MSPEEFEALFRRTAPEVRAYLHRRVGSVDADDLVGEVFVIAWRRREDLPEPELRRAWLYGVARRLVLGHVRKQVKRRAAARELAHQPDAKGGADGERTATVRRILETLPEVDRELIMLTIWEGLTTAEAALALSMRSGTARVRLHRARQRLAADPEMRALIALRTAGSTTGGERLT